jgi:hypothetical protein
MAAAAGTTGDVATSLLGLLNVLGAIPDIQNVQVPIVDPSAEAFIQQLDALIAIDLPLHSDTAVRQVLMNETPAVQAIQTYYAGMRESPIKQRLGEKLQSYQTTRIAAHTIAERLAPFLYDARDDWEQIRTAADINTRVIPLRDMFSSLYYFHHDNSDSFTHNNSFKKTFFLHFVIPMLNRLRDPPPIAVPADPAIAVDALQALVQGPARDYVRNLIQQLGELAQDDDITMFLNIGYIRLGILAFLTIINPTEGAWADFLAAEPMSTFEAQLAARLTASVGPLFRSIVAATGVLTRVREDDPNAKADAMIQILSLFPTAEDLDAYASIRYDGEQADVLESFRVQYDIALRAVWAALGQAPDAYNKEQIKDQLPPYFSDVVATQAAAEENFPASVRRLGELRGLIGSLQDSQAFAFPARVDELLTSIQEVQGRISQLQEALAGLVAAEATLEGADRNDQIAVSTAVLEVLSQITALHDDPRGLGPILRASWVLLRKIAPAGAGGMPAPDVTLNVIWDQLRPQLIEYLNGYLTQLAERAHADPAAIADVMARVAAFELTVRPYLEADDADILNLRGAGDVNPFQENLGVFGNILIDYNTSQQLQRSRELISAVVAGEEDALRDAVLATFNGISSANRLYTIMPNPVHTPAALIALFQAINQRIQPAAAAAAAATAEAAWDLLRPNLVRYLVTYLEALADGVVADPATAPTVRARLTAIQAAIAPLNPDGAQPKFSLREDPATNPFAIAIADLEAALAAAAAGGPAAVVPPAGGTLTERLTAADRALQAATGNAITEQLIALFPLLQEVHTETTARDALPDGAGKRARIAADNYTRILEQTLERMFQKAAPATAAGVGAYALPLLKERLTAYFVTYLEGLPTALAEAAATDAAIARFETEYNRLAGTIYEFGEDQIRAAIAARRPNLALQGQFTRVQNELGLLELLPDPSSAEADLRISTIAVALQAVNAVPEGTLSDLDRARKTEVIGGVSDRIVRFLSPRIRTTGNLAEPEGRKQFFIDYYTDLLRNIALDLSDSFTFITATNANRALYQVDSTISKFNGSLHTALTAAEAETLRTAMRSILSNIDIASRLQSHFCVSGSLIPNDAPVRAPGVYTVRGTVVDVRDFNPPLPAGVRTVEVGMTGTFTVRGTLVAEPTSVFCLQGVLLNRQLTPAEPPPRSWLGAIQAGAITAGGAIRTGAITTGEALQAAGRGIYGAAGAIGTAFAGLIRGVSAELLPGLAVELPDARPLNTGALSWYNPTGTGCAAGSPLITTIDCYDRRVVEDICGLEVAMRSWVQSRPGEREQQIYNQLRSQWELAAGPDAKKKIADKIAGSFQDREVRIDGQIYTVRNPYRTAGERVGVSGEHGFLGAISGVEGELRRNYEVLQAYLGPSGEEGFQGLVLNNRVLEMMLLESLWHCGNSTGPDADPRCYPAKIIEELREYRVVKDQTGRRAQAEKILKRDRVARVHGYAIELLKGAIKATGFGAGLASRTVAPSVIPGVVGVSGEPVYCISGGVVIGDIASGNFCVSGGLVISVSGDPAVRVGGPAEGTTGLFCVSGGEVLPSATPDAPLCIRGRVEQRGAAAGAAPGPVDINAGLGLSSGLGNRRPLPRRLTKGLGARRGFTPIIPAGAGGGL